MWTNHPRTHHFGELAAIAVNPHDSAKPPLILIHGVGLRAEAWAGMWPHLTDQFRVFAVDMPGHGESTPLVTSEETLTLSEYAEAFRPLITGFSAPVFIAGHSMGAMLSLELAIKHPDTVAGIAPLNAIFRRTPEAATAVRTRADSLSSREIADPAVTLARWFGQADSPEKSACRTWLTGCDPAGYKAAYTVFSRHDGPANAALQDLHCPALFLTAEGDPNSTPAMSGAMTAFAPQGRAVSIPDAAHMAPMTHGPEIAAAICAHLRPADQAT